MLSKFTLVKGFSWNYLLTQDLSTKRSEMNS